MEELDDADFLRKLVEGCDVWIDKATADRVREIADRLEKIDDPSEYDRLPD
jgi:hypothetical protein